jgi:16S rRNA U516 pseudouridylate synthase RsuA-like enzyme
MRLLRFLRQERTARRFIASQYILRELVVVNGVVRTKPVAVKKYKGCENVNVDRTPLSIGGNS